MPQLDERRSFVVALVAAACGLIADVSAAGSDINGRWIAFDHDTGQKRAVIEITSDKSHARGRIVEFYPQPGEDRDATCERCNGADHARPIRGLTILVVEAEADGERYRGTILDPEEGQTYKCIATLSRDRKQLHLRGYVGIELFGRNQTWSRAD